MQDTINRSIWRHLLYIPILRQQQCLWYVYPETRLLIQPPRSKILEHFPKQRNPSISRCRTGRFHCVLFFVQPPQPGVSFLSLFLYVRGLRRQFYSNPMAPKIYSKECVVVSNAQCCLPHKHCTSLLSLTLGQRRGGTRMGRC